MKNKSYPVRNYGVSYDYSVKGKTDSGAKYGYKTNFSSEKYISKGSETVAITSKSTIYKNQNASYTKKTLGQAI